MPPRAFVNWSCPDFFLLFLAQQKELCGNLRKLSWCPIEAESGGNGQRQALFCLDHSLGDGGMQDLTRLSAQKKENRARHMDEICTSLIGQSFHNLCAHPATVKAGGPASRRCNLFALFAGCICLHEESHLSTSPPFLLSFFSSS